MEDLNNKITLPADPRDLLDLYDLKDLIILKNSLEENIDDYISKYFYSHLKTMTEILNNLSSNDLKQYSIKYYDTIFYHNGKSDMNFDIRELHYRLRDNKDFYKCILKSMGFSMPSHYGMFDVDERYQYRLILPYIEYLKLNTLKSKLKYIIDYFKLNKKSKCFLINHTNKQIYFIGDDIRDISYISAMDYKISNQNKNYLQFDSSSLPFIHKKFKFDLSNNTLINMDYTFERGEFPFDNDIYDQML